MNFDRTFPPDKLLSTMLIGLLVALISAAIMILIAGGERLDLAFEISAFVVLALIILRIPYLGVVVTITSLPVLDILPPVPYATSAVSLLGGVTLIGYFLQHHRYALAARFPKGLLFGLLFIIWLLSTTPIAALQPGVDNRIWFFTFMQLWIFAWLSSRLLDSPYKHHVLMWAFSIATVISAVYAIQYGVIEESLRKSVRASGLAGGANAAARYFVVDLVFLYYLRARTKNIYWRFILLVCMAVVILGTLSTVSRTGMLLLITAIGMLFIQRLEGVRRTQAMVVLLIAVGIAWFFADNAFVILRSIFPAIRQGTDTIGIRYGLWQAGLRMWLDHPFLGVGIGRYVENLPFYGWDLIPLRYLDLGAHNLYIQVLAETGIIGLMLFVAMLGTTLQSLWRAGRCRNQVLSPLAQTWLMVIVLMLIGGITKHDHYNKLIWLVVGVAMIPFWKAKHELARR